MYQVLGTDISFYQRVGVGIDFVSMRDSGAKFSIIRAGQNLWEDTEFKTSWKNCRGILPRGSYWFYDSRVKPETQAALWLDILDGDFGELPLWCDFEDRYGGRFGTWNDWYRFITYIEKNGTPDIGIYTGYYYWLENTVSAGIPNQSLEFFSRYPLWIAAYGTVSPKVPRPWTKWTLWQFTDNGDGKKFGVGSLNIDLNYYNGDYTDFAIDFGIDRLPNPTILGGSVEIPFGNKTFIYREEK